MRELVRLTECVKKNGALTLTDETATYDLEVTFADFWMLSQEAGITIAIDGSLSRPLRLAARVARPATGSASASHGPRASRPHSAAGRR